MAIDRRGTRRHRSPSSRGRRGLRLVGVALALLLAAYSGWWWFVARTLETSIADWVARERAAGTRIELSELKTGGFPAIVTTRTPAARLVQPDGTVVTADAVTIAVAPWSPGVIDYAARTVRVAVAPGAVGAAANAGRTAATEDSSVADATATATADALSGTVSPAPNGAVRLSARAVGATLALEHRQGSETLVAGEIVMLTDLPGDGDGTLLPDSLFRIEAAQVGLPSGTGLRLGPTIATARIALRLTGQLSPASPRAIADWARSGGHVTVDALDLDWGPLGVRGNGTVQLDARLQPAARLSLTVSGWDPTLDALAADRVLTTGQVGAARVAATLMANAPPPGVPTAQTPEVGSATAVPLDPRQRPLVLPVTIEDRWLSVGPLRLTQLPPIPWE